jgi:outer membrane protein assembly factor BamE (lipoprotein component of BamABCDE complex)
MKKRNLVLSVFLAGSVLILQGCASHGNESLRKESEGSVKQRIVENKTTKQEIRAMFGSPLTSSFIENGSEIWKYELSNVSGDAVNYIPIVNMFGSSASGKKKELIVLFNDNGTVKKYNMSESDVQVKTGLFNN